MDADTLAPLYSALFITIESPTLTYENPPSQKSCWPYFSLLMALVKTALLGIAQQLTFGHRKV